MKTEEYTQMYRLEFNHWWYTGLDHLIFQTIRRLGLPAGSKILDAGCGTGRIMKRLSSLYSVYGFDFSEAAIKFCKKRGIRGINRADISCMPFASESFHLTVSLDVIYHQGIQDDAAPLNELYRVIKPGGYLILQVPALEMLRGNHDRQVATRERYTRSELIRRVKKAGFDIPKASYRLFVLFPIFILSRVFQHKSKQSKSDLSELPGWANRLLYRLGWLGNHWLDRHHVPLGSSIFLLARKPHTMNTPAERNKKINPH